MRAPNATASEPTVRRQIRSSLSGTGVWGVLVLQAAVRREPYLVWKSTRDAGWRNWGDKGGDGGMS